MHQMESEAQKPGNYHQCSCTQLANKQTANLLSAQPNSISYSAWPRYINATDKEMHDGSNIALCAMCIML